MFLLSLDIGGTQIKSGLFSRTGEVLQKENFPSQDIQAPQALIDFLEKQINSHEEKLEGVSIGLPGLVTHPEGKVLESPHFPQWKNLEVRKILSRRFHLPIHVHNDVHQAALAEIHQGIGQSVKDFIFLTLGTGIGGAVIKELQLLLGKKGLGGELGHIIIELNGYDCACGGKGCLETLASESGLKKLTGRNEDQLGLKLYEEFQKGQSEAIELWKNFGRNLALGICSLVNTLGIFDIVIGGGLSAAWDAFIPSLEKEIPQRIYASLASKIKIHQATLNNEAGIYGGYWSLSS